MACAGRAIMINGGNFCRSFSAGRLIPKRGQVKVAILLGLAHSVASIFSQTTRRSAPHFS